MTSPADFLALLSEADALSVDGWDFEWLNARAPLVQQLPWNWRQVIGEFASGAGRMLDMGTGGGEELLHVSRAARFIAADESWPPNVPVAAANLRGVGIPVVQTEGAPDNVGQSGERGRLPYRNDAFDVISNRHESFRAEEVARVLAAGGHFVTQQVDNHNFDDLREALGLDAIEEPQTWIGVAEAQLTAAGLEVIEHRHAAEVHEYRDIGAVAWYLRMVSWSIPEYDAVSFRPRLEELHRRLQTHPLQVREPRFLVVARKP